VGKPFGRLARASLPREAAKLREAATEQSLEVENGLDVDFEFAGQFCRFLESGAIAGEELLEAAFASQE